MLGSAWPLSLHGSPAFPWKVSNEMRQGQIDIPPWYPPKFIEMEPFARFDLLRVMGRRTEDGPGAIFPQQIVVIVNKVNVLLVPPVFCESYGVTRAGSNLNTGFLHQLSHVGGLQGYIQRRRSTFRETPLTAPSVKHE